jgi:guanylate kinase
MKASTTELQQTAKSSQGRQRGNRVGRKSDNRAEAQSQQNDDRNVGAKSSGASSMTPLLFVISAPSGGGKTTLCQELLAVRKDIARAITCTTRAPRPGEKEGVDYYFLDAGTFLKRVQAGHFLEHATVYGNSYGTLRSEVLDKLRQGKDVLLNIDVQGAASIRECVKRDDDLARTFVSVFLTPPSLEILEARLKKRGQDSSDNIRRRISVARQELAQWKHFDYLIISTSVQEDLRRMLAIVEAEKMRQCRAKAPEF